MTVFPSVKSLFMVSVSSFNLARINPTITPKIITGSISPLANEFKGLSGIMSKIVLVTVTLVVTFEGSARPVIFKPIPGSTIPAIKRAIETANAVVKR